MQLSHADVPPEDAERLAKVGITNVPELAGVEDVATVAGQSGIAAETLATYVERANAHMDVVLEAAGITQLEQMAAVDVDDLSERTNIPRHFVVDYRERARRQIAEQGPTKRPAGRVVLAEGREKASYHSEAYIAEGLPLVTATHDADVAVLLASLREDSIVLQVGRDKAWVHHGGETIAGVPLYEVIDGGREIRVRVAALRERRADSDASFFRRIFGPPLR